MYIPHVQLAVIKKHQFRFFHCTVFMAPNEIVPFQNSTSFLSLSPSPHPLPSSVLGMEPKASYVLGRNSAPDPHLQPLYLPTQEGRTPALSENI